ncbi:MAG: lipoate protein ligase C-terminal domain-containing protein, partial [Angelakisella sp.]
PAVTVEGVKAALIAAFGELYGLCPLPLDSSRIDREELVLRSKRFASYDWRIGGEPDFTTALSGRFGWGGIELLLGVSGGLISSATVYTDAMDAGLAPALCEILTGTDFSPEGIAKALSGRLGQSPQLMEMANDVSKMMEEWQNG